jgi:sulfite exporter TauE/SafE
VESTVKLREFRRKIFYRTNIADSVMELLTAFIVGLLGSLHCIGMCGPIALALPGAGMKRWSFISGRLQYNSGRILTYVFIGTIFGLLGSSVAIYGFQQALSITLGIIVILSVLLPRKWRQAIIGILGISSLFIKLKNAFSSQFRSKSRGSLFVIGLLNGFLPCGFVYIGVTGAAAVSSAGFYNGSLFMLMFGLGTLPVMLGTSLAGNLIGINVRKKIAGSLPVFAVVLGLIFILRGMNLGIPYISPKYIENSPKTDVICH